MLFLFLNLFIYFFVTQAILELLIFLLQQPKSQGYSYTSYHSFLSFSLKLEPEAQDYSSLIE